MLKKIKKYFIFSLIILFSLTSVKALENDQTSTDKKDDYSTLTVTFKTLEGVSLNGAEFNIYKVATLNKRNYLDKDEPYKDIEVDFDSLTDEEWLELPDQFTQFIDTNNIAPTAKGQTDQRGEVKFDNLTRGLYLVRGYEHKQDKYIYKPVSFFIKVPGVENDAWKYEVTADAKYTKEESNEIDIKVVKSWEDEGKENKRPNQIEIDLYRGDNLFDHVILDEEHGWTHTWLNLDKTYEYRIVEKEIKNYTNRITTEDSKFTKTFIIVNTYKEGIKLPDTGLLWWPVPILFGSGLILISIGFIINRKKDKDQNEE